MCPIDKESNVTNLLVDLCTSTCYFLLLRLQYEFETDIGVKVGRWLSSLCLQVDQPGELWRLNRVVVGSQTSPNNRERQPRPNSGEVQKKCSAKMEPLQVTSYLESQV